MLARLEFSIITGWASSTRVLIHEGNQLLERTNIGNSVTQGFEIFLEYNKTIGEDAVLRAFTSIGIFDARYQDARRSV